MVNQIRLRYILTPTADASHKRASTPTEGSHNGSAAVLKTAGRKAMQVRVLSPPPFLFKDLHLLIRSAPIRPRGELARSWRASRTKRQWLLVQRIHCGAEILWHCVRVSRSHLQSGVAQQCHNVH